MKMLFYSSLSGKMSEFLDNIVETLTAATPPSDTEAMTLLSMLKAQGYELLLGP